jgi:two-component system cell cycle sensor histidine kinase/response regulator CckA
MKEPLRLLLIEDSESDAALTVRALDQAGYQVHWRRVEEANEMRQALQSEVWDVIFADHKMVRFDAPGALQILRNSAHDIPFIIVSGSIGEELAVAMMKSGASDYVNKNNLSRLVPAVEREIREARSRCDRARAERDLRDSEERLALAVQATQLGTFDYFPQTGRLIWSDLAKRHFGLPADAEVSYDIFLSGIHPHDRLRVDKTIQSLLTPGSDGRFAAEYRTIGIDDDVERWISSWGRVYFNDDGNAVRFVGVKLDVTSRKKLEDQFRQAQKLESVGRLAGGVAHDFNNLLTVINGHSEMMLEQMHAQDPMRTSVSEIHKAGGRAAELTRQLLAFSRKQPIDPKPVNLNQLVTDSRNMLSRLIGEDIELVTNLDPDPGMVLADGGQLHQVLMNLVVNARDAMPKGGRLTIETTHASYTGADEIISDDETRSGDYVVLVVADNGHGIDESTRKRIFEPFFTTKDEGVGTGLGLATVYGIVQQCGGWIDLTTAPGAGARFTIGLPRTHVASSPDAAANRENTGGGETILVVEDQEEVRELALIILRGRGYRLLQAANGNEALAIAGRYEGPIHLLLTDVVMPGINGQELANRLLAKHPTLRVLFMSGYAENVITHAGMMGDELNYLVKPFTPATLARKVRVLLGNPAPLSRGAGRR